MTKTPAPQIGDRILAEHCDSSEHLAIIVNADEGTAVTLCGRYITYHGHDGAEPREDTDWFVMYEEADAAIRRIADDDNVYACSECLRDHTGKPETGEASEIMFEWENLSD